MPVMLNQATEQTEVTRIALRGETMTACVGTAGNEGRPLHVCVTAVAGAGVHDRQEAKASEDVAGGAMASVAKRTGRYEEDRQCPNFKRDEGEVGRAEGGNIEHREWGGGKGVQSFQCSVFRGSGAEPRSSAGKGRPGEDTQPYQFEIEDGDENEDDLKTKEEL